MAAKTLFNPNSSETLFSSSQRIGSQHDSSQQKPPAEQSHDHDSDETQDPFNSNSQDGGATSQVMPGGHSCRHGNSSQGSIGASKDDGMNRQKRKSVQEGEGPSAKRPGIWDHLLLDHLDDKILEETASELPPRKLLNKWALKRKLGESCHYFAPQGVTTGQVVQRLLELFKQDQANLRRLQDSSVVRAMWGPPVITGYHVTDTIWRAEENSSVDGDASLVGAGKRLRCRDAKVEAPNIVALCTVNENGDSPRVFSDSDSHRSDNDFDWLPDLKDHAKKRRQPGKPTTKHVADKEKPTTKRVADKDKPTTKRVVDKEKRTTKRVAEKLERERNVESVPDTPPGWIKSPAALKAESAAKSKVSDKQMLYEATLNSILMQGQAKVAGSAKQRRVVKREPRQNAGGKRGVKRKDPILANMFTDDDDSTVDDCDEGTNKNRERVTADGRRDTGNDVRTNAMLDSTVNSASCDAYFKPVARVHQTSRAGVLDETAEGGGNQIEVNAVVMETRVSPTGRAIAAVANVAQSIVAGATSLLRRKAVPGKKEVGTLVRSQSELTEISSGEDEDLGEAQQQQQQQQHQNQQGQQHQQQQQQQNQHNHQQQDRQQQQQQNQQHQQQSHQRNQQDGEKKVERKNACHQQEQVNCPMCFKYFSVDGIEEHAFACQGEPAPSSCKEPVAPLEGATAGNVSPIFRHTIKPLRQYGRQRRNQDDGPFNLALGDGMETNSSKHSTESAAICDINPEGVEILSDSDFSATPRKRRKGNARQDEQQVGSMKCQSCPICSKSFTQSLIEAHVVRCLESAETDRRTTRSRREPDRTGGHLGDNGFDENMPINPRKRQTYLKTRQTQPLITSKLMGKDASSPIDTFRRYSTVVNTLKSASDHQSDSDSDSSSSESRNFSDDRNEDHPAAVHSGISRARTSPLRTFKRISDQGNAVLDYHNQFRKGDPEKARQKSEARASNSKWRSGKRKGKRKKKAAPKKKKKLA